MSILSLFHSNQALDEVLIKERAPVLGMTGDDFGFQLHQKGKHVYLSLGDTRNQPLIFCHGIFGSFRNIAEIAHGLKGKYQIIVPCLPMYDVALKQCSVKSLGEYLVRFTEDLNFNKCIVAGNSMGGGAVLHFSLLAPEKVEKIILFSSSGLSFIPMRKGALKIRDYEYMRGLLSDIFYDKNTASEKELQEAFQVLQKKSNLIRIFSFTRSTKKDLMHEELPLIQKKCLVIWGKDDEVTPLEIGKEFQRILPNNEFHVLDKCGHVPPYEKPQECLKIIKNFLEK
ncbi:MAG: alpha/beta hydrolase [Bdellovibrionota bacterium]|nr:alpha/beta hydrolase [Bdellovibrionota bacterium]